MRRRAKLVAIHGFNSSNSDGRFYVNAETKGRGCSPKRLLEFEQPTPGGVNGLLPPILSEFLALEHDTIADMTETLPISSRFSIRATWKST